MDSALGIGKELQKLPKKGQVSSEIKGNDLEMWSGSYGQFWILIPYVILIPQARVLCLINMHKPEGTCVYIRQKHECLWYKYYVPHCLCRLIARREWLITSQYKLEHLTSYIHSWKKFDYGPAHAGSNHVRPMFINKNGGIQWKLRKVVASD